MPFGLKNIGSTYQRCMNRCLSKLIREVIEVYIDNIIVKLKKANQLVNNLEAAFAHLQEFIIKLNPKKCVFRVPKGELLGFIIFERGTEANLEKIAAIKNLGPISNLNGL